MRKYILFALLIASCFLIAGAFILSFVIFNSKIEWYWQAGPLIVLVFGMKMIIEVTASMKVLKNTANLVPEADVPLGCLKKATGLEASGEKMKKTNFASLISAMNKLYVTEGDLTPKDKELWIMIQEHVPYDHPVKILLKKKFFTCEFEDLNQPICSE